MLAKKEKDAKEAAKKERMAKAKLAKEKEKAAANFQAGILKNMETRMGSTKEELQRAKEILRQAQEDKRKRSQPLTVVLDQEEEEAMEEEQPSSTPVKTKGKKEDPTKEQGQPQPPTSKGTGRRPPPPCWPKSKTGPGRTTKDWPRPVPRPPSKKPTTATAATETADGFGRHCPVAPDPRIFGAKTTGTRTEALS